MSLPTTTSCVSSEGNPSVPSPYFINRIRSKKKLCLRCRKTLYSNIFWKFIEYMQKAVKIHIKFQQKYFIRTWDQVDFKRVFPKAKRKKKQIFVSVSFGKQNEKRNEKFTETDHKFLNQFLLHDKWPASWSFSNFNTFFHCDFPIWTLRW